MKFHIGQPVWAICDRTHRWVPAVVTHLERRMSVRAKLTGPCWLKLVYTLSTGQLNPHGEDMWCAPGSQLRPRDPDQHTPATDVLELGRPREIA